MTPEEFAEKMRDLYTKPYEAFRTHKKADMIIINLLEELGYKEGANIYKEAYKTYDWPSLKSWYKLVVDPEDGEENE